MYKKILTFLIFFFVNMKVGAENQQFNNWQVACDNFYRCMAVGVPDNKNSNRTIFIKITRNKAVTLAKITVIADKTVLGSPGATLTLAFNYPATPIINTKFLSASAYDSFVKVELSAQETQVFMSSLDKATYLLVRVNSLKKPSGKLFRIALSGLVKTLEYMDEKQKGKDDKQNVTSQST